MLAKGAAVGVVVGMSVIVILVGTGVGNDDGSKDGGSDGWREGAVVFSCAIVVVVLLITTRRHNATTSRLVFHIMVFLQEKVQTPTVSFLEIQAHTRRSRVNDQELSKGNSKNQSNRAMPIQYLCATRAVDCQSNTIKGVRALFLSNREYIYKVLEISSLSQKTQDRRKRLWWQHDLGALEEAA